MKDRIKEYIDYKNISPGELATILEVQRSNISHILNGRNKPGAAFIEKFLLSFPDLDARWLLTGKGSMLEKPVEIPVLSVTEPKQTPTQEKKESPEISPKKESETPKENIEPEKVKEEIPVTYRTEKGASIEKVVLLYSDGTFSDFSNKSKKIDD